MPQPDAIVIGSGPNGLAAAIVLAQAGLRVTVFEAEPTVGGGSRSAELTLPGFVHDLCSAVHATALASPFFRTLPLAQYGLEFIHPPLEVAHPFDDGSAAIVERSVERTAALLGRDDESYARIFGGLQRSWPNLESSVLGPLRWPQHPLAMAAFGMRALRSASGFANSAFAEERTRALFGGIAAHGLVPLDKALTAGFGLVLGVMAHMVGWVIPRGGAQKLTDALVAHLRALGGEVIENHRVTSLDELPRARAVLCDLSPRPFLKIAGARLPASYRRSLERYRYGMGVFKVDWALDGPIPWKAAECGRASTVHLGGTLAELELSEQQAWSGTAPDRPFVLLTQPTLFDPSRAPAGKHTVWTYCHVPGGSTVDMLPRIEAQIERFAPGFRDRILARSVMSPAGIEGHNANYVGGDIGAGIADVPQFFTRPTWRMYSTPVSGLYLCSAATPPGVGVHGMCGYFAAQRALADIHA
ncbi:MAG: FAD-dependent oxidoreductase [Acidobacteria bacterium]|nr:MAG: FAD-dependent oxidoreductase [Acidobacteriota bacterium]